MYPDDRVAGVRDKLMGLCAGTRMDLMKEQGRRLWFDIDASSVKCVLEKAHENWSDLHLSTITGLDTGEEIELIYHFVVDGVLVNLKVKIPSQKPEIETVANIMPAADSYERELHDLLGVEFSGRETTQRLVLPDVWKDGVYPLRKDPKGDAKNV